MPIPYDEFLQRENSKPQRVFRGVPVQKKRYKNVQEFLDDKSASWMSGISEEPPRAGYGAPPRSTATPMGVKTGVKDAYQAQLARHAKNKKKSTLQQQLFDRGIKSSKQIGGTGVANELAGAINEAPQYSRQLSQALEGSGSASETNDAFRAEIARVTASGAARTDQQFMDRDTKEVQSHVPMFPNGKQGFFNRAKAAADAGETVQSNSYGNHAQALGGALPEIDKARQAEAQAAIARRTMTTASTDDLGGNMMQKRQTAYRRDNPVAATPVGTGASDLKMRLMQGDTSTLPGYDGNNRNLKAAIREAAPGFDFSLYGKYATDRPSLITRQTGDVLGRATPGKNSAPDMQGTDIYGESLEGEYKKQQTKRVQKNLRQRLLEGGMAAEDMPEEGGLRAALQEQRATQERGRQASRRGFFARRGGRGGGLSGVSAVGNQSSKRDAYVNAPVITKEEAELSESDVVSMEIENGLEHRNPKEAYARWDHIGISDDRLLRQYIEYHDASQDTMFGTDSDELQLARRQADRLYDILKENGVKFPVKYQRPGALKYGKTRRPAKSPVRRPKRWVSPGTDSSLGAFSSGFDM